MVRIANTEYIRIQYLIFCSSMELILFIANYEKVREIQINLSSRWIHRASSWGTPQLKDQKRSAGMTDCQKSTRKMKMYLELSCRGFHFSVNVKKKDQVKQSVRHHDRIDAGVFVQITKATDDTHHYDSINTDPPVIDTEISMKKYEKNRSQPDSKEGLKTCPKKHFLCNTSTKGKKNHFSIGKPPLVNQPEIVMFLLSEKFSGHDHQSQSGG